MAAEFGWWPMSPWLSPGAAWFIFINIVVGAIAVMTSSRGQQDVDGRGESGTRRKLVRTASTVVLDSLRSISIFSSHSAGDYSAAYSAPASQLHHVQEEERYHTFEEETQEVAPQLQLSMPEAAPVAEEQTVVLPPQSAHVAALGTSATASESHVEDGEPSISFDEAYALARASRRQAAADTVARVPGKRVPLAEIKVRAYGRCGRGTEEVEGKAEVNERAEQFIRQFREELKLERINSILNYTHALRRGAGAATAR
ncbi:unnamed protein product [Alopecurus aequalis]